MFLLFAIFPAQTLSFLILVMLNFLYLVVPFLRVKMVMKEDPAQLDPLDQGYVLCNARGKFEGNKRFYRT